MRLKTTNQCEISGLIKWGRFGGFVTVLQDGKFQFFWISPWSLLLTLLTVDPEKCFQSDCARIVRDKSSLPSFETLDQSCRERTRIEGDFANHRFWELKCSFSLEDFVAFCTAPPTTEKFRCEPIFDSSRCGRSSQCFHSFISSFYTQSLHSRVCDISSIAADWRNGFDKKRNLF